MAEPQMDSGQNSGSNSNANSGASGGDGAQQNSSVAKLQASFAEMQATIARQEAQLRALQGNKDRNVQKALNEVTDLREKFAKFQKLESVLGAEGAIDQIVMQDQLTQLQSAFEKYGEVPQQSPAGNGNAGLVDVTKAIDELGLDKDDPAVKILASRQYASDAEFNAALVNHLRQASQAPSLKPSQAPADNGGQLAGAEQSTLKQQFLVESAKIAAIEGLPHDERIRRLSDLEVEFRNKGME